MDSSTAFSDPIDSTIRDCINILFYKIFLIVVKCDIMIQPQWIEKKLNGLPNIFSGYDNNKIDDLCPN